LFTELEFSASTFQNSLQGRELHVFLVQQHLLVMQMWCTLNRSESEGESADFSNQKLAVPGVFLLACSPGVQGQEERHKEGRQRESLRQKLQYLCSTLAVVFRPKLQYLACSSLNILFRGARPGRGSQGGGRGGGA